MSRWQAHPSLAPDHGSSEEVLASLLVAAKAWEPSARILANIRAEDIVRAITDIQSRCLQTPSDPNDLPTGPRFQTGDSDGSMVEKLVDHLETLDIGDQLDQDDVDGLKIAARVFRQLAAERLDVTSGQFEPPIRTWTAPIMTKQVTPKAR